MSLYSGIEGGSLVLEEELDFQNISEIRFSQDRKYFMVNDINITTLAIDNNFIVGDNYFDVSVSLFVQCGSGCSQCANESSCTECTPGYVLIAGECFSSSFEEIQYLASVSPNAQTSASDISDDNSKLSFLSHSIYLRFFIKSQ